MRIRLERSRKRVPLGTFHALLVSFLLVGVAHAQEKPNNLKDAPACPRFDCADYILLDCLSGIDGPLLVYSRSTERLLDDCGYWSSRWSDNRALCSRIDRRSCSFVGAPNRTLERDARKSGARPSP